MWDPLTYLLGVTKMNSILTKYTPYGLGFQQLFADFERLSNRGCSYPPYNAKVSPDQSTITVEFAVSGFTKENLIITEQNGNLIVEGIGADDDNCIYLHKGISSKSFQQTLKVKDYKVSDAALVNGILTINLQHNLPEEQKPKVFAIS